MIKIEESNPSFKSCSDCIYSDDSEEMCILRRCIHAVLQLKECYVPKQPTIEPERKKGRWLKMSGRDGVFWTCNECGEDIPSVLHFDPHVYVFPRLQSIDKTNFCPNCGADMRQDEEDIPMEYFESGGR